MGLFGKQEKDPKVMVNEWKSNIRKEGYKLDRQIKAIQREEEKAKRTIKDYAKKGHMDQCKGLAKEIVNSRKAVSKIYAAKAQMNSVALGLQHQLSLIRMSGALAKSTEVMKSMQALIKLPEIQATMMEMSKEMMKAGIIEEMMDDAFEMTEDDDLEEDTQKEVDKILFDITAGELGKAPAAVKDSLPTPEVEGATADVEDEDEEVEDMKARLEALRS